MVANWTTWQFDRSCNKEMARNWEETGQTVGRAVSTEYVKTRNCIKTGCMDSPGSQMKVIQSKITEILQRPTTFVSYCRADRHAYKTERDVRKVQTKGETAGYVA